MINFEHPSIFVSKLRSINVVAGGRWSVLWVAGDAVAGRCRRCSSMVVVCSLGGREWWIEASNN